MRYTIPEGITAQDIDAHYNLDWHEDFKIIAGSARYILGNETKPAVAGETINLPENIKHIHPHSDGKEELVVEQFGTVQDPAPGAIRNTLAIFFTLYEWEAEGKIKLDKVGLPVYPMKFALAGRIFGKGHSYDARIPKILADIGGGSVGRLVELPGYSVIDPKWR